MLKEIGRQNKEAPKKQVQFTRHISGTSLNLLTLDKKSYKRRKTEKLTFQEVEELQEVGGYKDKDQIKRLLLDFINNRVKNVSFDTLVKSKSKEQREREINIQIEKISKQIKELIGTIDISEKQRQENYENAMREIEHAIQRKFAKNELKWLKVNTEHDHLKAQLKQKLIEELQNPDTEIYQEAVSKRYQSTVNLSRNSELLLTPSNKSVKYEQTSLKDNFLVPPRSKKQLQDLSSNQKNKRPLTAHKKSVESNEYFPNSNPHRNIKMKRPQSSSPYGSNPNRSNKDHNLTENIKNAFNRHSTAYNQLYEELRPPIETVNNQSTLFKTAKNSTSTNKQGIPLFINCKDALISGATLYNSIESTFDQFVESCKDHFDYQEKEEEIKRQQQEFIQKQQMRAMTPAQIPPKQRKSEFRNSLINKATLEAVKLDYQEEQDKSKPLHLTLKLKEKRDPILKMKRDLEPTVEYLKDLNKQIRDNSLIEYPKTNIHFYSTNFQKRKSAEKVLEQIHQERIKNQNDEKNYPYSRNKSVKDLNSEVWNKSNEDVYYEHRKEMRHRLTEYSTTGPWDKVLMGQYTQMFKKQADANTLNDEYGASISYRGLHYDQVKQIVAQLPSLNNCLDKKEVQSLINRLDYENINNLETEIATNIIKQYREDQQKIKDTRFKFLKTKSVKTLEKVNERQLKWDLKNESVQKRKEHMKSIKKFRTIINGMENNKISLKTNENDVCIKLYREAQSRRDPKKEEQLILPRQMKVADPYQTKQLYEYFQETGMQYKSQKKLARSVGNEERREQLVVKISGGPPPDRPKQEVQPNQTQIMKATMIIQQTFRFWKAQRAFKKEKEQKQLEDKTGITQIKNFNRQNQVNFSPINRRQYDKMSPEQKLKDNISFQTNQGGSKEQSTKNQTFMQPSLSLSNTNLSSTDFLSPTSIAQSSPQFWKKKKVTLMQNKTTMNHTEQRQKQLNFINAIKINNESYLPLYGCLLTNPDINSKDDKKNSALYYAIKNNNEKIVDQLLKHGADPNIRNENNNTVLHEAFKVKNVNIVKTLIQRGADLLLCNNQNQTAFYSSDEAFLKRCGLINYLGLMQQSKKEQGKTIQIVEN